MNLNLHYSAFIMTHADLEMLFQERYKQTAETPKGKREKEQIKKVKHAREDWELLRYLFSK